MQHHIFNTSMAQGEDRHHLMIENHCATAFYETKDQAKAIEADDVVFLYQNEVGIVACGIAAGETELHDWEGDKNEAISHQLKQFVQLEFPITFNLINSVSMNYREDKKGTSVDHTRQSVPNRVGEALRLLAVNVC